MRTGAGRQSPHHVPAREAADQASIRLHDGQDSLGRHLSQDRVEAGAGGDDLRIEVEETGDRLRRPGGREAGGADATDEAAVAVGGEPGVAPGLPDPRAGLRHRVRRRQDGRGTVHHLLHPHDRHEIDMLDEPLDIIGRRPGHDFFGLSDLDDFAVLHEHDAAPEGDGLVEIVRDEHDGLLEFLLQLAQLRLHIAADQRIEGAERLVHEQDIGVGGERPGEAGALLHAARELVGILGVPAFEPHELDGLHGALGALRERHPLDFEAEADVPQDRPVGQQREVLEHHPEGLLAKREKLLAAKFRHIDVVDQNSSAGRLDESVHTPQERRLSRAGKSHQDEDLTFVNLERDVTQSDDGTASFGDLGLSLALGYQRDGLGMLCAEDLADSLQGYAAHVLITSTRYRQMTIVDDTLGGVQLYRD